VQFLQGRLAAPERDAIERACLQEDPTAFAELVALEDELRFLFVAGALSALDRQTFEARYLRTVSDRARLMFARALLRVAGAERPGA
jgi:hypothetical protein